MLAFALSLVVLGAEPPLQLRLPSAEVGAVRYSQAQLVAALYQLNPGRLAAPGTVAPEPAQPIILLWEDGRVLWSEDPLRGGPPFRTGSVTRERVAAVVTRFKDRDASLLTTVSVGPDASAASLVLRLPGGRYALMTSWHPREPGAKTIATSRGLEALNGRDPSAVLAADVPPYQAFRKLWQELEDELVMVAHSASVPKAVSAKLEWSWLTALPPQGKPRLELRLELRLEGVNSAWQFAIDGKTLANVAALRAFLEQQPKGTIVTWDPGCRRMGNEPLLSNDQDLAAFKAFCAAHGIELVILPGG